MARASGPIPEPVGYGWIALTNQKSDPPLGELGVVSGTLARSRPGWQLGKSHVATASERSETDA
jgi:hypothetical protein